MNEMVQNGVMAARLSPMERFWRALGFGRAHVPRPDGEPQDGFAEGYMITGTLTRLGWADRIRALVSGRVMVETAMRTDVVVTKVESVSAFRVLPPGHPIPRRA